MLWTSASDHSVPVRTVDEDAGTVAVSRSSVSQWKCAVDQGRSLTPGSSTSRSRVIATELEDDLRRHVLASADVTLAEQ